MAKEVLIYSDIHSWTAESFINEVNETEGDLTIRIDSNGGDPQATYGMVAKYNEFEGNKKVKVDGRAYSSAMFFITKADNVEALDVSKFLVHRAAYSEMTEKYMDDEMKAHLIDINEDLRSSFEAKVDVEKFNSISGVSMDEVFSMDDRIDVFLNAEQAKEIGLIDTITPLTSSIKASIDNRYSTIAAKFEHKTQTKQVVTNKKVDKMTIEKLRAEHPEVYSAIVAEERDRVGAYLAFVEVDAKAVSEGIKSGDRMSQTMMAEMAIKMNATASLAAVEAAAAPAVEAAAVVVEDEKTEYQKTEARLMESLNLKTN